MLRRLMSNIEHLDGAIRLYDQAYKPRKVVLRRGQRVGISRTALEVLRDAKAPKGLRELRLAVLTKLGRGTGPKAVSKVMERVRTALLRQQKAEAVQSTEGPGLAWLWEVVR